MMPIVLIGQFVYVIGSDLDTSVVFPTLCSELLLSASNHGLLLMLLEGSFIAGADALASS